RSELREALLVHLGLVVEAFLAHELAQELERPELQEPVARLVRQRERRAEELDRLLAPALRGTHGAERRRGHYHALRVLTDDVRARLEREPLGLLELADDADERMGQARLHLGKDRAVAACGRD